MHRRAGRNDELIDAGDALIRVDEQPLPVERDDLDLDRRILGFERPVGIERMRSEPGDAAEKGDDQRRDRPDDEFELAGERPVGPIGRAAVGGAKPPGEAERGEDHRDDDRQHDRDRVDENEPLRYADRPARIENAAATRERKCEDR